MNENEYFAHKITHHVLSEPMWVEYDRIKKLDKRSLLEDEFVSRFRSWDKGDCSPVGLVLLTAWYVTSIENSDPYRNNEYAHIIEFLRSYHG